MIVSKRKIYDIVITKPINHRMTGSIYQLIRLIKSKGYHYTSVWFGKTVNNLPYGRIQIAKSFISKDRIIVEFYLHKATEVITPVLPR